MMLDKRSNGSRTRELTRVSKLTGNPERPRRLERMRTGWDVHFRELALTRIPVKITTPSQHFKLLNIFPDTAAFGKPSNAVFLAGKRNKLFWFRLTLRKKCSILHAPGGRFDYRRHIAPRANGRRIWRGEFRLNRKIPSGAKSP
ncbi:MAG TPA: hypothetical protein VN734_01100, partial [Acidobacteriaceae bacterium]|nr:hypothetical protein [Acidobacteriaceae bacterium]